MNVCSILPSCTCTPNANILIMYANRYKANILSNIPAIPNVIQLIGVVKNFKIGLATWYITQNMNPIRSNIGAVSHDIGAICNPQNGIHSAIITNTAVLINTDRIRFFIILKIVSHKGLTILDKLE